MALEIPADMGVAKIRFRGSGDSQEMITTIGFARNLGATAGECAFDIAEAWTLAFSPAELANAYAFAGVEVAIGPQGAAEVGYNNRNTIGTANMPALPSNCALLITKITAQAGKAGKGRMYVPAGYLNESEVDANGFLSGGALDQLQSSAHDFFTAAGGGTQPSILSWMLFHSTEAAGNSLPDQITDLSVEPQIATQRQRMRR